MSLEVLSPPPPPLGPEFDHGGLAADTLPPDYQPQALEHEVSLGRSHAPLAPSAPSRLLPSALGGTDEVIRGTTKHSYHLEADGHKWLTLNVLSQARVETSLPVFVGQKSIITGSVEVDLKKTEKIKSITISVVGGTTFVGQDEILFLNLEQTLWGGDKKGQKSSGSLQGHHSWSFEFTLPNEVTIPNPGKGHVKEAFPLPPYYTERASPAYLDYRISVNVRRGFLKMTNKLSKPFAFVPFTVADPPSFLRQMVYQEMGSKLLGPEADPDGWRVLPPVLVKGTLFSIKEVEVKCTLAIATPLSYAIGTPIPLILTLESDDAQALDVLSAPTAITVYLVRTLATGSDATEIGVQRRSNNYFETGVSQAYFWLVEGASNPHDDSSIDRVTLETVHSAGSGGKSLSKRVLHGEIEVMRGLKPSFVFPRFTIRYQLDLLPFSAPGYTPAQAEQFGIMGTGQSSALLSEPVSITTAPPPGVVARSYAPPGYVKPPAGDYNKSVGLLENGNQRFYHHHGGW
ncbi:hypothetical protein BDN72DRAFT_778754 [Pluteus cervinus]|uniref:Uncharacterized protein n=1 Tax=Pluteus cervinus TaxID=181527 RepID=A0ACD3A6E7_9AGAR|nr:hypothetical protein BDN72DRAFT_778754 [Pluteus cervinus]